MKRKMFALALVLVLCFTLTVPAAAASEEAYVPKDPASPAFYAADGDADGPSFAFGKYLLISLGIGLVIGLIVVFVLKGQLKTVRKQNLAHTYVRNGSMHLTVSNDLFLYRNVVRTKRADTGKK